LPPLIKRTVFDEDVQRSRLQPTSLTSHYFVTAQSTNIHLIVIRQHFCNISGATTHQQTKFSKIRLFLAELFHESSR